MKLPLTPELRKAVQAIHNGTDDGSKFDALLDKLAKENIRLDTFLTLVEKRDLIIRPEISGNEVQLVIVR